MNCISKKKILNIKKIKKKRTSNNRKTDILKYSPCVAAACNGVSEKNSRPIRNKTKDFKKLVRNDFWYKIFLNFKVERQSNIFCLWKYKNCGWNILIRITFLFFRSVKKLKNWNCLKSQPHVFSLTARAEARVLSLACHCRPPGAEACLRRCLLCNRKFEV